MKYFYLLLIGFLSFNGFSQAHILAEEDSDKKSLADFIHTAIEGNILNQNPVVIVNERVLEKEEWADLSFYKPDILDMSFMVKDNPEMVEIYGNQGINGVLLIETKPVQERAARTVSQSKVLFLLDNKPIEQDDLEKINPDDVQTITVIKNESEIAKYTSDEYDGVIIIEMKEKK